MEKRYKHFYTVYGINLDSDIEVLEFVTRDRVSEEKNRVTMDYGQVSEEIKENINKGSRMHISKESIWFHIDGVSTYWIQNGDSIIVEPCDNCDGNLMKIYIMGSVLGFLLLQREVMAVHGGTIVIDGRGVIFTGQRGAGKSTLTTALGQRGYFFVSDDVATINIEGETSVEQGFPYHKLCVDALENMNYEKENYTSFQGDGKVKYLVPDRSGFYGEKAPLSAICEINVGDVEKVQIEEVLGREKFNKIIKNIYRTEYISRMDGMKPSYFKQCMKVAKDIKFFKITRPRDKYTVDEQIQIIEKVFGADKSKRAM
ncbi:MAG: hypothetical protein RR636_03855 [Clostridium sp.]|uniref:hypothetical protein n=1 Tax=Clostridium sp. TaxID=1506 RepID=UPI003064E875